MPNSVAPSPPASGRMQNTEGQVQQDGASALHRVLCAESFAEKERRLSEMILQLQLLREQLLQQQDQSKVGLYVDLSTFTARALTSATVPVLYIRLTGFTREFSY